MFYNNNPDIIEFEDIVAIKSLDYDKEQRHLTVVFKLVDEVFTPKALCMTDGTRNVAMFPDPDIDTEGEEQAIETTLAGATQVGASSIAVHSGFEPDESQAGTELTEAQRVTLSVDGETATFILPATGNGESFTLQIAGGETLKLAHEDGATVKSVPVVRGSAEEQGNVNQIRGNIFSSETRQEGVSGTGSVGSAGGSESWDGNAASSGVTTDTHGNEQLGGGGNAQLGTQPTPEQQQNANIGVTGPEGTGNTRLDGSGVANTVEGSTATADTGGSQTRAAVTTNPDGSERTESVPFASPGEEDAQEASTMLHGATEAGASSIAVHDSEGLTGTGTISLVLDADLDTEETATFTLPVMGAEPPFSLSVADGGTLKFAHEDGAIVESAADDVDGLSSHF